MTGILDIPANQYHADAIDDDQPTLSRSLIHLLCTASPAHAWTAHPRLNPKFKREEKDAFDLGTAAHDLFLGGPDRIAVIKANDWRTSAAKAERDKARAEGKVPLLYDRFVDARRMVAALTDQLADHEARPPLFQDGKPEQTLVWEDRGVLCRARLDWLRNDLAACDDLKTTSRTANPESWARSLFGSGYDIQAEFYRRGIEAVTGTADVEFRFAVIETYPPFALSVISLAPDALVLARKKIDYALDLWRQCLERDEWPAYEPKVAYATLPAWEESRWLEKEGALPV